jgi:predicted Zn-dependent protease
MRKFKLLTFSFLLITITFLLNSQPLAQTTSINQPTTISADLTINWTPPPARAHNKGPYVPPAPKGNNIFTDAAEAWLADAIEQFSGDTFTNSLENPAIQHYVTQVGQQVARYSRHQNPNLRFTVLRDDAPEATSIGDGRIFVSTGLISILASEDELAGILAHEIGHDDYKHVAKTLTRQMHWMIKVKKVTSSTEILNNLDRLALAYQKNQLANFAEKISGIARLDELKADHEAFYTTYRAGYNPRAIITALKRLEAHAKTQNHPNVLQKVKKLVLGTHPLISHRAFFLNRESSFIKLPPIDDKYDSSAFVAAQTIIKQIKQ